MLLRIAGGITCLGIVGIDVRFDDGCRWMSMDVDVDGPIMLFVAVQCGAVAMAKRTKDGKDMRG